MKADYYVQCVCVYVYVMRGALRRGRLHAESRSLCDTAGDVALRS